MHERLGDAEATSSERTPKARSTGTANDRAQAITVPGCAAHILNLQRAVGNAVVARAVDDAAEPVQRSAVHEVLRSSGKPLDEPVRADMETRLGADFSDVRLHTGTTARRSAAEIGARAYTSGNHIVIGDGGADKHTLAHELTHVIQQRQGPVAGTDNGNGLKVSDPSDRFEREAEANATRVMSGPSVVQRDASTSAGPHERLAQAQCLQRAVGGEMPIQRVLAPPTNPPFTPGLRLRKENVGSDRAKEAEVLSDGNMPLGSPPQTDPAGYAYIRQLKLTMFWIRFHLVNEKAGGAGVVSNLVPASQRDNRNYELQYEAALKRDVVNAAANPGDYVFYGVSVTYPDATNAGPQRQRNNQPFFPSSLEIYHMYFSAATGQWTVRHNGATFAFRDPQPADLSASAVPISGLTLDELKTIAPDYKKWTNDDLSFLQTLGGHNKAEFEEYVKQAGGSGVNAAEHALETIKYQGPASATGRPSRNGGAQGTIPFAHRIDNGTAIRQLAEAIASGQLTL